MDVVLYHFDSIDSTNTWAKQQAGLPDGGLLLKDKITLITADTQTGGRGRFNRQWVSPPNQNLYATFCFFVEQYPQWLGNVPQVMAISLGNVLELLGFQPRFKWPNDILLSNKKVAGVLCETLLVKDRLCIIVGVGLNINMPLELIQEINRPATSLLIEAGRSFCIKTLIQMMQEAFVKDLSKLMEQGFPPFLEIFRAQLVTDEKIRFNHQGVIHEGIFQAIDDDGALLLKTPSGSIERFISGEIE